MSLYTRLEGDMAAQTVLGHLGRGKDASVSIGALSERLGWTRRMVELSVNSLRGDGFPVCSDGTGVWLGSAQDLDRTIASLQRRIVAQVVTLRALRKTLRRMRAAHVDQLGMFDSGEAA